MHSKVEHESGDDEQVFYLLIWNKYMPVLARVKKYLKGISTGSQPRLQKVF